MRRWSLTTRFAVVSLLAVLALAAVVGTVVQRVVTAAATAEAARSGQLLAHFVDEGLTADSVTRGLTPAQIAHLDRSSRPDRQDGQLRNLLVYAPDGKVLYDSKGSLEGQVPPIGPELSEAFNGHVASEVENDARAEHPERGSLLEVYVPLDLRAANGRHAVLEVYLSYAPTLDRATAATRLIRLVLLGGLALLWGLMWLLSVAVNRTLRRQSQLNEHLALHDTLTALPNRRNLAAQAQRLADGGTSAALVLLDLDRFKDVNDALGHTVGDELLKQVADRLTAAARDSDVVARLGGDEFAVLVRGVDGAAVARTLAERVVTVFEEPFLVGGVLLDVEPSTGVALLPDHASDADTLLQRADVAMYSAKKRHLRVAMYEPALDGNTLERLSMLTELRAAVGGGGGLHLVYQPTVDLTSGAVVGVEALARWNCPGRGLVQPADFIPLAEGTGLIGPLTEHVLHLALAQCRVWMDDGLALPIAVNLSARNLLETDLADRVGAALAQHGVPAELLVLEITESAVVEDPVRAEQIVRALVGLGVRIAIDDFGTGYSSMAALTRLPLDCLKVDRSFVADLDTDGPGAVIVTASIRLAHDLGMRVVAEGVETPAQLDRLGELGCDVVQGYLLARPLPAGDVPSLTRRSRAPSAR
ncbi:MAG: Diguanylate cyclase protein [Frankiales bacterium]|nr:Diguanylate cyclase protein [Frankiales bacterium]